jgi:membrane fusion protein (multidrug efflux system)
VPLDNDFSNPAQRARPLSGGLRTATLVMLVAVATLAACKKADDKPAPPVPEVGYVVLKTESVALTTELGGRTSAYETSDVRPQVSGVIQARLFEEGSLVKAGQTLYRIDPSLYRAAEAQARANLASAEANREAAEAKAKRYKPLSEIEAVSKQDYSDAQAIAQQAAAAVAQNRALVEIATINQRFTSVPAPITGRIGRSIATTGALVTANQADALTTIQRLDPIFVDIPQSSADLVALRRSLASGNVVPSTAEVRLKLEDGSDYPLAGVLQFTEAMVDAGTGAVTLRARFPNPNGLLLPGMYVRARLSQSTARDAILVPQQAVSRDPRGAATVMLVGADDKLVQKTVTADRTVRDQWLVTSGLAAGDRVVTEGLSRVKAGQTVKAVPAGSKPAEKKPDADAKQDAASPTTAPR